MATKKVVEAKIVKLNELAKGIYEIVLQAPEITKDAISGQFVNLYTNDKSLLLPRPISICDVNDDELRLVFGVVGKGTLAFSKMNVGDTLRVSSPLGNGYDLDKIRGNVTLVAGGIGVPPMLLLAKQLKEKGIKANIVLGYRDESFLVNDFKELGLEVAVCTDSGKEGYHGNTVAYLRENNINSDIYCACGPKPMLKFLSKYAHECDKYVYLSMEERMGCGYGACVGCVIDIYDENHEVQRKKVCKDGPVFDSREVVWDD